MARIQIRYGGFVMTNFLSFAIITVVIVVNLSFLVYHLELHSPRQSVAVVVVVIVVGHDSVFTPNDLTLLDLHEKRRILHHFDVLELEKWFVVIVVFREGFDELFHEFVVVRMLW